MNNKFKVISENNEENMIEVITVFNHKDKEYVIYSLPTSEDKVDICVSRLEEDKEGYSIFTDITDDIEKKEIDDIVKELLEEINK